MAAEKKMTFGNKILMAWGIICIAFGAYKCTNKVFGSDTKEESSMEKLSCNTIQSWQSDEDIINSLQGTWIMENEDYYGKRKFQFSGRSGKCWKMENGSNEWNEEGAISFDESSRYDSNTRLNVGVEYIVSYNAPIGWFRFNVDCTAGISVPSDRYTYGISLLKVE